MRMLEVADSVLSLGDVYGLVRHHLYVLAVQESLLLLSYHIGDAGLVGVEIVAQLLHGVCGTALLHHRLALDLARKSVQSTPGEHCAGIHVILHIVGAEFHVLVLDGHVSVKENFPLPVAEHLHGGILAGGEGRHLE